MGEYMKLVVAEKPSVGKAYASVLGATESKNGYMEGNGYIVSWCFGHLVELFKPDDYTDDWGVYWRYDTLPMIPMDWKHKVSESSKEQYKVLESLMRHTDVAIQKFIYSIYFFFITVCPCFSH